MYDKKKLQKYTVHNAQDYTDTHHLSKQNREKIICANYIYNLNNAQDTTIG